MNPFVTDGAGEVRHALRTIEKQLARGLSVNDLAAILNEELKTCPHLRELFRPQN